VHRCKAFAGGWKEILKNVACAALDVEGDDVFGDPGQKGTFGGAEPTSWRKINPIGLEDL
jgi:hypothetical protein